MCTWARGHKSITSMAEEKMGCPARTKDHQARQAAVWILINEYMNA